MGLCLVPLVAWLLADWKALSLVSVLPLTLVFLAWKIVPESPRFLLTRYDLKKEINKILLNGVCMLLQGSH